MRGLKTLVCPPLMRRERGIGGGLPEAEGNEADWFSSRPEEGASEWLRCKAPRVRAKATQQIGFHHAPKKERQNG